MDSSYDRKFEEMKKYIPFLESMIKRLENTNSSSPTNPRQAQLDKIRSLRDLLLNKNKRMKMDNLLKCEQVLVNLHAKVEKDPFSGAKPVSEKQPTVTKEVSELETVRNKLKSVAKIQDGAETLPEIARANDVELNYTGSKEPALFQRRPNKSSLSPMRSVQNTPSDAKTISPLSQHKRNYTRVLVSPDRSSKRWLTPEQSDKPLFSRRSPPKTSSMPSVGKREKKKTKTSKTRKTNDLNITLNVPQESLNSLNTEDILSRIINCKDGDVDIDTLRELRTQILGELKQTGKNDDISDLILKSYNIKTNPKKKVTGKTSKEDVEEGELSDSESETIESIYGNLPVMDRDKMSTTLKTIESKDQQRKIQICLIISDKVESNATDPVSELDISRENESDKSEEVITVDSDTASSPIKKYNNMEKIEANIEARKIVTTPSVIDMTLENETEYKSLGYDNQILEEHTFEETDKISDNHKKNNVESKELLDSSGTKSTETSPLNNNVHTLTKRDLEQNQNADHVHENANQQPKFVANFYKPIEEHRGANCSTVTNNIQENNNDAENIKVTDPMQSACTFNDATNNIIEKQNDDINNDTITSTSENRHSNEDLAVEKEKDESQNIPLLNEPTIPPKAKDSVFSEIDILQALKNEILSGSISVPGTEVVTPALHQPKLTKVANVQEVMPKKKISLEKYKEKVKSTSTAKPLFFKNRSRANRIQEEINKKQSLKLTEKECERFNFPKRLSLDGDDDEYDDEDDINDYLVDDDFLAESKDDSLDMNNIYGERKDDSLDMNNIYGENKDDSLDMNNIFGDLAPKSPDNDLFNKITTSPVIIPTDSKLFEVRNKEDVDMRALLPTPFQPQHVSSPLIPSIGCGTVPSSPPYGNDRKLNEVHLDSSTKALDVNLINTLDPRNRRDLNSSAINSPNPNAAANTERTFKSFTSIVAKSAVSGPNMTPSRMPNMTPSYMPSTPQLRTPNARTFEVTPSHQTFELEEPTTRKHVYAPLFPTSNNRERESSVSNDGPYWDMNKIDPRSRSKRWEESSTNTSGPKWEDRRSSSALNDGSYTAWHEDSYTPKYDKYNNRLKSDKYTTQDRRESYSTVDCPMTPNSAFGRQEAPMTPSHPSRSDCPSTPVHPFGLGECPSTQSGFGANIDMASNHTYSRLECPPTPSHSFGRSECPQTPSHSFGRSECPRTPSHPFGRSESIPYMPDVSNNFNQTYSKDPRLNRRPSEYDSYSHTERNYEYKREQDCKSFSYKSQSKHNTTYTPRNYERERNVGRNKRDYGDPNAQLFDRNRRDESLAPSASRNVESNPLYSRNRKGRYDGGYDDLGSRHNQREKSAERTSETKQCVDRVRSTSRARSVCRSTGKEINKDNLISCQSETGRNFTINTSVKSTFQDFLPSGKPIQVFEYSVDTRRQRAVSVGRSLLGESRVGRTLSKTNYSIYAQDRNYKFKRASSVGREITKTIPTLQEVKADLEAVRSKLTQKLDTSKESKKHNMVQTHQEVNTESKLAIPKEDTNKELRKYKSNQLSPRRTHHNTSHQHQQSNQNIQNYSPKKNSRDPRMRKDHRMEIKSHYYNNRKGESRDGGKSGIIYSNDNIAKGTIMGSGFGVKNYKIPKIKRAETPEVKPIEKDISGSLAKDVIKKHSAESDKTTKQKISKEPIILGEELVVTSDCKNQTESKKSIDVHESEVRVTRSKKKTASNNYKDDGDDVVVRTKKSKKSVIYDSDSDSVPEKQVTNKCTQRPESNINSACKDSKTTSPVIAKQSQKDIIEDALDSNFGIDDMAIFPDNLESNSVIHNINDLIADLDNDLVTSKTSNDSFTTDIENMMETINSPGGNSLGDITEVIEKDLNKSKTFQQDLISNNLLDEQIHDISNTTQQPVNSAVVHNTDLNISRNPSQKIDVTKNWDTKQETLKKVPNIPEKLLKESTLSNVNEDIVSTNEVDQVTNEVQLNIKDIANSVDQSDPDSKTISGNIIDGLPDSTNEIYCELSSDVTSTLEIAEISSKESEVQSTTQKDTFDSIGSLLSILQDKSKIKEILAMLGDKSRDNEKIKKKLEKLSEIVSDDDEEEEIKLDGIEDKVTKPVEESRKYSITNKINKREAEKIGEVLKSDNIPNVSFEEKFTEKNKVMSVSDKINENKTEEIDQVQKKKLVSSTPVVDITIKERPTEVTGIMKVTDKVCDNEIKQNKQVQENDKTFTLNIESNIEAGISVEENVNNNQSKSSNTAVFVSYTRDKNIAVENPDGSPHSHNKNKDTEKTSKKKINIESCENPDETNKLDDEDQSDSEDDQEPLVKIRNNKIKGKNLKGKCKAPSKNTNKRTPRAVPAKTGVKKRGELQKLQEDIKEMFMREDILNATGIRMCRLAKMVENDCTDSGPVVVLEKVKELQNQGQPIKERKKPGPKPKTRAIENKIKPSAEATKMNKSKAVSNYKPGPKSKTKPKVNDKDPYEFDTDAVADTNTAKESDDGSSDSENESLASTLSYGKNEVLTGTKKKPRRKRRGHCWKSGIIKSKNKKKKEQKRETPKNDSSVVKPQRPVAIPDHNCFTDKSYCFQKSVTTYDCRLCEYSGTEIVQHYKKRHPHSEIPLSRLNQKAADFAIQQCQQKNYHLIIKLYSDKYTCQFCHEEFVDDQNLIETFFWHVVNHTGEIEHSCSECVTVTSCPFKLTIPRPPEEVGQLIGYICQKCNFTQVSLDNLKTHVIEHHNDEHTEVFPVNLSLMSNKTLNTLLRRAQVKKPKALRSLRSNQSVADSSDIRDNHSDASESSHNSDPSELATEDRKQQQQEDFDEHTPKICQMKAKLTFENDEPSDDTSVKMEEEDHHVESLHFDDSLTAEITSTKDSRRGNSDEIVDYPHFKLNYTDTGAKEYVCCINGNDSHYKTSLLISMKKHIQSKHSEKWDGYCSICKVIVTLQGVQSDFRDCLSHFLDKHMDDFPVLQRVAENIEEIETSTLPESNISPTMTDEMTCVGATVEAAVPATVLPPALAERTASPSYIAVRPLAELISRELMMTEIESPEQEEPTALPRIKNVISLGEESVPPSHPSPSYPTNTEPIPQPEKPFLYEEVQAEVMSKKHRVVLDTMMSKENLVRVFKCAGRFCSFTTDSPEDALVHASTHQRVGGEGALNCAYCNYDACENGIDLVMHVFKEHSRCQYCCPMCFYRAAASQLVAVHYSNAHAGAIKLVNALRSTTAVSPPASGPPTDLLPRNVAVQQFVCNYDVRTCAFRTFTPRKYIEHLQLGHASATSYQCNLCPTVTPSAAELVMHVRSHGLKLYQCTRCVHGANNEVELLAHAAAKHPDSKPQAYIRLITTNKEGEQRVLPLAYLNKFKVPAENVSPNTTKENPVREAERSIELEKLIAHTMMLIDASTSESAPMQDASTEEPEEIPVESLHDDQDSVSMGLDSPLTATDQNDPETKPVVIPVEKIDTSHNQLPDMNADHAEALNDLDNDIICLDSDNESNAATEDSPVTLSKEPSSTANEAIDQTLTTAVSKNTDEESITKATDEGSSNNSEEPTQNVNIQLENIIDLSDDDPATLISTKSDQIVSKKSIFKCPACLKVSKTVHTFKKHVNGRCSWIIGRFPKCPHLLCTFIAPHLGKLISHYMSAHSEMQITYNCGICTMPFFTEVGAKTHIRTVHKVVHCVTSVSVDANGARKFEVNKKIEPSEPVRISGRKTSTEIQRYQATPGSRARKPSAEARRRYGIEDIDKLPISPIIDSVVYCDLCEFGTKVRVNMVRHLQQHAGNVPVSDTAPVNPVPCLDSKERYFDKMVNLASSSVTSRASEQPRSDDPTITVRMPLAESARYPKYVPERLRYTCGAIGCSYISVDMAMFRCHWETLHARDNEYRCVHCPPTQALTTSISLTAARILGHLRMHDVSLYACSDCSYYHYRKHLVESHISEVHHNGTVKVVREESQPDPATPSPAAGAPTMDLKPWQCGFCEFSSMLRPNVVNHCATEHQSKMQFKCTYCSFRSSAKENIVKHHTNAHPTMPEDVFYYFYREGSIPDEDGVPRWQKQRQKLRPEERDVKTEPEPETVTEKANTPISITPACVTPAPVAVDLNIVKEETAERSPDTELAIEELFKKFGKFCEPDGIKFKCCLCAAVTEHSRDAMQSHLYEELNYRRWECVICSYKAFHKSGLHEHMACEHSRQFTQPRPLPVDINIEKWVQAVLDYQYKKIESNISNLTLQKIQSEKAMAPALPKEVQPPMPAASSVDSELPLEDAFGDFGAPKCEQFACPKCDFTTKDEESFVTHLESELAKIRWGCTICASKFQTFHVARFHCQNSHANPPASPKEAIRDPAIRSEWINTVVTTQRQLIKPTETNREHSPDKDEDSNENSLLVALYDEPVHFEEYQATPGKRPTSADSDDERLVIDEPPNKKAKIKTCPFCEYNIQNSRYVREHILKEHYNMKPYKCSYCTFDGTRQAVTSHTESVHADSPKRIVIVQVPEHFPGDGKVSSQVSKTMTTTSKRAKDSEAGTSKMSKPDDNDFEKTKRDAKDSEEMTRKVCLYCEKSVSEAETESHTHGNERVEFAMRGEVVVKCCKCLVLRLSMSSLQEHFDVCHPGEKFMENYAYFKLQVDTREIHCCGHCYKKFKFLRDLRVHHATSHTSLSLSYTSIPFNHNLHTEGDTEPGKRKAEDAAGPSMKRIARKSTSKLNSAIAKKSTTKPYTQTDSGNSYCGSEPAPLEHYGNVVVNMPIQDSLD